jgi:hypothetical protein
VPQFCLGGPACAAYPSSTHIVGQNRYDTAVQAAAAFFTKPEAVGIASGQGFADALSGGAHIGGLGPLLLTDPAALPDVTASYLSDNTASLVVAAIYGGTSAVSDDVLNDIDALIRQ